MAENKKYEFVEGDTIIDPNGKTLRRIRALGAIGFTVAAGDLGGYIEAENNLSVSGDAWVSGDAQVSGDAWVYGNSRVSGNSRVYGNSLVYGNAQVSGDARVSGDAAIVWFSNVGSENGTLTVFKGESGLIVTRGCFCGSIDEFLEASNKKHGGKIKREYQLLIEVAKSRLEVSE